MSYRPSRCQDGREAFQPRFTKKYALTISKEAITRQVDINYFFFHVMTCNAMRKQNPQQNMKAYVEHN